MSLFPSRSSKISHTPTSSPVAIRENVGVSTAIKMETNNDNDNEDASLLAAYVHGKVGSDDDPNNQTQNNAGLAAAVVDISGKGVVSNPELAKEVGKKLAMHIVAAKPTYLNISNIPTELVEKEKELLKSQIVDSQKTTGGYRKNYQWSDEEILFGHLSSGTRTFCGGRKSESVQSISGSWSCCEFISIIEYLIQ